MSANNITPPTSLFIDPRTGTIAREWYLFLIGLTKTLESILAQFKVGTIQDSVFTGGWYAGEDEGESNSFSVPGLPGPAGPPGPQGASAFYADADAGFDFPLPSFPSPAAQVVTGSKLSGAALVSLLAALSSPQLGLIIDKTSA